MNGRQVGIGIISMALALVFAQTAWSDDRHKRRHAHQNRQLDRIHKGIRSGEITKREYQKLRREQHQIHRAREKARSDGKITPNERRRIANLKRKADRHIYMANHNHHKQRYQKPGNHRRYHRKFNRQYGHHYKYRSYDDYWRPYYRRNSYFSPGLWLDPYWGVELSVNGKCRR